jgi:hypothetical protein
MAPIRLHISRTAVSIEGPDRARETTRALVALGVEAGRIGIIAVGDDEPELAARFAKPPAAAPARGLRAQIVARAADKLPADKKLRIVRPGDDSYWDRTWQDSYALRSADPTRSRELLLVAPLSEGSWSPHLAQGLLMYALWTGSWTRNRVWPAFRRPQIELCPAEELCGLHYEELVDQLRALWGARRVLLPAKLPVAPPPPTRMVLTARVSHVLFWVALIGSFLLSRGGKPSSAGVIAAAIAIVAFIVRRVALARAKAELPRRRRRAQPQVDDQQNPSA